ncbi:MAG: acetylglutamate kinase, partial [Candidatus Bathyarchaeota archaeon]|nr:acetylglutamate kinase [Candidatus Bathyarchaeota archaeon]
MDVLKLGGSVVTDKDRPKTANNAAIKRLAREVASAGP